MLKDIIEGYRAAKEIVDGFKKWHEEGITDLAFRWENPEDEMFKQRTRMDEVCKQIEGSRLVQFGVFLYTAIHPIRTYNLYSLKNRVL